MREVFNYMQFLPIVEFLPSDNEANNGQNFAAPSGIYFSSNEKHGENFYAGFLTCGVNMMSAKNTFS